MEMITLWLIIGVFTIVAELHNPGLFYFLSLACGAGAALASCLMEQSIDIQVAWFVAIAAFAWTILKRIAHSKSIAPYYTTNADALIGKRAVVIERIVYPEKGYVKIGGEEWPAQLWVQRSVEPKASRSPDSLLGLAGSHGLVIEPGEYVEIMSVSGNHLVVKQITY